MSHVRVPVQTKENSKKYICIQKQTNRPPSPHVIEPRRPALGAEHDVKTIVIDFTGRSGRGDKAGKERS